MNGMPDVKGLNIKSEIGPLKSVMLHRPGRELERLTPENLHELLFDDIPWLRKIREEHDGFARAFESRGVKVYYVEKLLEDALKNSEAKKGFIAELIDAVDIGNKELEEDLTTYLDSLSLDKLVETSMAGLTRKEVPDLSKISGRNLSLVDYISIRKPFLIEPLPNLYFTRDPGTVVGRGLSINCMMTEARWRESMFLKYIHQYNDVFGGVDNTPLWYKYDKRFSIEGGDILILSNKVVAIGCSQRTAARGIEEFARNLFASEEGYEEVLVIQIPFERAYMHLDTVFTMVDRDKFTIYPGILERLSVYSLTRGANGGLKASPEGDLLSTLKRALKIPACRLIETGGGDAVTAAREQWNDGTNTLAIAPGVALTYDRNEVSNEALSKAGIEVITIEGSELVRGRGGPRCMSMPLSREEIY